MQIVLADTLLGGRAAGHQLGRNLRTQDAQQGVAGVGRGQFARVGFHNELDQRFRHAAVDPVMGDMIAVIGTPA